MKKSSTVFLKAVILLIAIVVLAGMVWFPQTEGRAANLDLISIYADPFIVYTYVASLPFFFGLFQAFKLLILIETHKAFSQKAVNLLGNMKFASLGMVVLIVLAMLSLRFFANGEDSAGPVMLGIILALIFGVIATVAGTFQKLFQNAVDMKSENDLTI